MQLHLFLTIFFVVLTRLSNVYSLPENVLLYLLAPAEYKVEVGKYKSILKEKNDLKSEQNKISAQDQYAKWTKNNRKLEKLEKDLTSKKQLLQTFKTAVTQRTTYLKMALITIPFFAVKFYYGKQLVFLFEEDHLSPMLPKPLQYVCTVGFIGVPMNIAKKVLSEIIGKKQASSDAAVLATHGVSLGIWVWALEKVISEIAFVYENLFSKISKPESLDKPFETVVEVPETETAKIELIEPTSADLD